MLYELLSLLGWVIVSVLAGLRIGRFMRDQDEAHDRAVADEIRRRAEREVEAGAPV